MYRYLLTLAALSIVACSPPTGSVKDSATDAPAVSDSDRWLHGGMVVAAHPYAVDAAAGILANGGHAVDAAIAAHAVLGLVEPESSGLGGSGFLLVAERGAAVPIVYDGRETAPAGATADMFVIDGKAMGFREAWQTGLAVGVPGTVALYEAAHRKHGRLPWADLFRPAIALARDGFEVSPKLHGWLTRLAPLIENDVAPDAAVYLYPDGKTLAIGDRLFNPQYADTLSRIANEGATAFYRGEIAAAIAERAQRPPMPGPLTVADLATYEVVVRDAVCGEFRTMRICSAPPPSSGIAQIMIANLYDRLLEDKDAAQPVRLQAFVDAQRLAYADRDRYIADPAFADVPVQALLDRGYLLRRAAERFAPRATPVAGELAPRPAVGQQRMPILDSAEQPGTSHLSIVDADGNAVALTASVGAPFGSLRLTHGFLLNNEMSDFSLQPPAPGQPAVNAIAPGKRPRSSMSPTVVYDADGRLALVSGSPGGNSIVAYVSKSILGLFDWGLTLQAAADFPNIVARGDSVRVETADANGQAIADELARAGYDVQQSAGENSGLHLIAVTPQGLEGAADKRRDGTVARIGGTTK